MSTFQAIQKSIEDKGREKLTDLTLSGIKIEKLTTQMKKIIEQCPNLNLLIMNECQLSSLANLPDSDITSIDLSSNKITDCQIMHLKKYKGLVQVLLTDNKIHSLQCLDALKDCKRLQDLDLQKNPVCKLDNYRKEIFQKFNALDQLDGHDEEGNIIEREDEFDEDDDEGEEDEEFDEDDDDDDDQEDYDEDYDSEEESVQKGRKIKKK